MRIRPAPTCEAIADAIETALAVGELDVETYRSGAAVPQPYLVLARCLDRAGKLSPHRPKNRR